jgi:hypothetical protein
LRCGEATLCAVAAAAEEPWGDFRAIGKAVSSALPRVRNHFANSQSTFARSAGWHEEFQSHGPDKLLLTKIKAEKNWSSEFECARDMEHIQGARSEGPAMFPAQLSRALEGCTP